MYFHAYYFVYTMQDFHVWGKNTACSMSAVDRGAAQPRTGLCFKRGRHLRPCVCPVTWHLWRWVAAVLCPWCRWKQLVSLTQIRSVLLPLSLLQTLLLVASPHGYNRFRNCPLCSVFIAEVLLVRIRSKNSSSVHGFAFWWKIITGLKKYPR